MFQPSVTSKGRWWRVWLRCHICGIWTCSESLPLVSMSLCCLIMAYTWLHVRTSAFTRYTTAASTFNSGMKTSNSAAVKMCTTIIKVYFEHLYLQE